MHIVRGLQLSQWAVGCIVGYNDNYCLVVNNDVSDAKYALLDIEIDTIVAVFDDIYSLDGVEMVARDLSVRISF